MTLRWFFSRTERQATEMTRQMMRLINEQRDILSPDALSHLTSATEEAQHAIRSAAPAAGLKAEMKKLEEAASKWLKPYPHPGIRENIKEFLVAIVVILSFTTFFLQLTKIPTGSMQPTLYGITSDDLSGTEFKIPSFPQRFVGYWIHGFSYTHLVAPFDGEVLRVDEPNIVFPFIKRQRIEFGVRGGRRENLYVWLPQDERLVLRANLSPGRMYQAGDDIINYAGAPATICWSIVSPITFARRSAAKSLYSKPATFRAMCMRNYPRTSST
jgi:signal peptidase I